MVGWVRSNAAVRSQTHTSPPWCAPISDTSRSRTGSPRALNTWASPAAAVSLSGSPTSGAEHASTTTRSSAAGMKAAGERPACIDMPLS